eukprot:scaffold3573_cov24-Phaeocystis_antarctica.AAC.1
MVLSMDLVRPRPAENDARFRVKRDKVVSSSPPFPGEGPGLRAEWGVQFWRTADSLVITPVERVLCPPRRRRAARLDCRHRRRTPYAPAVQLASQHLYQPFTAPNLDTFPRKRRAAAATRATDISPPAVLLHVTCQLITHPRR